MSTSKKKTPDKIQEDINEDEIGMNHTSPTADTSNVGSGNINKIRDILFGVQMREFEKRFQRTEDRMTKELKEIREDVKKNIDSVESFIRQEVESLSDLIKDGKNERLEIETNFNKELAESSKGLDKKIAKIDEQLTKSTRDMRQHMLDQSKSLTEEIRKKYEDNSHALEKATEGLDATKIDHSTLAEMLTDMALRLTSDPAVNFNLEDLGNE